MTSKIITFFLSICMFTASAMANTNNGLKSAFDEFTYAVTVEWDQQDPAFLEAKKAELAEAVLSSGATREEVMKFAKSQIKDAALARDFDYAMNSVAVEKMSVEEAQAYMMNAIQNSHNGGAQWLGTVAVVGGVVLFSITGLFIYLLTKIPQC